MIERVIFTPEADDDVAGSYDWYESREPGLGEDFLRSVEACVRGIQRHPEMYPAAIDEFRRAPIRRFPFEIFYELTVDSITIYSVFPAHKIHKNGASVSAIEHTRLNIEPTADCLEPLVLHSFRQRLMPEVR